jgi:hypothetical protein
MPLQQLSPKVVEKLGYYVYVYINPLTDTIFYVGKGKGNRVFAHLSDTTESQKVDTINMIRAQGKEPRIEIVVHGFEDELTALRIEAALIDVLGKTNLTNEVGGWGSAVVGRMNVYELAALYDAESVQIDHPAILIRINQHYRYGMTDHELYEATRGVWRVGETRTKANYALAVYRGIVREVYAIHHWYPAGSTPYSTRSRDDVDVPDRWEFTGAVAADLLRHKYIGKSVAAYFTASSQNPITYVLC